MSDDNKDSSSATQFRIPDRTGAKEWFFRCNQCGTSAWYVVELPEHLRECTGAMGVRGCGGRLELIHVQDVAFRRQPTK